MTVTTKLDPGVDLSNFQLQSIGWGIELLRVPAEHSSYPSLLGHVQPNTGKTILVDLSAALVVETRTLTWTIRRSTDPALVRAKAR